MVEDPRRRGRAPGTSAFAVVVRTAAAGADLGGWAGRLVQPCWFRARSGRQGRGYARRPRREPSDLINSLDHETTP